ncbi:hypothetical protein CES85_3998 [Ochrobactrum quorumnocens]|uniref:Uncharacterized protein n=1 Tax=Ochrobactrum quorumnocens TaxID=271865 RepID=A0A248UA45_9HYPH|nr:hypothetical protein [[Ochrobactrum] quorumnocens]ASV83219.1 hypothetical protein CES85_3998 [[Ochrobactrum] quorumnocens]
MFFVSRTPPWGLFWVALAAIFFVYVQPVVAQSAGSWRVVDFRFSDTGTIKHVMPPPVCRSSFATAAAAVSCLSGKRWKAGYYTSRVGHTDVINSEFNISALTEGFSACSSTQLISSVLSASDAASTSGATSLYSLSCNLYLWGSSKLDEFVDVAGARYYKKYILTMNLPSGRSGSVCSGSQCSNAPTVSYGNYISRVGVAFFPNEPVEERPDESEDNECVDKTLTLALSAAEKNQKNPTPGQEFDFSGCTYVWEKPRSTPDNYSSACLTPIGNETLCFAKGIRLLSPPAPKAYEEVTKEKPLTVKIGNTASEQKALKAPDVAKDFIGWGGAFGKIIPLASQLPVVGNFVQAASQVSPDLWTAWLNSFDEGLVKFELDYKKEQSPQDYYHPGNHTEGGAYLGAFDRDWGKTEYDADKAWNWNKTPATEVEDTGKLAVIEQPNGPGSGGGDTYVTNITNHHNNTTINYPPGVTAPGGNPSAPPDSSVPQPPEDGGEGGNEGGYDGGNSLYTAKYPDGMAGVWNGFKDDIMQTSGIGEFLNAFKMPTGVATSDLCFNFNFNMGKTINLGEQGFCISENIILIVKALLIISAFLVARRLVFGG